MNLALRMRPSSLDEFVGQHDLVGKGKVLRQMIEHKNIASLIFWGPPGTGKTTLASIISKELNGEFYELSGVTSGKQDLMKIIDLAKQNQMIGKKTILFIDEIHRWNKSQQDTLLPFVESGILTLIGATTENPSFEVIGALLSRSRVFVLQNLEKKELEILIEKALTDTEKGMGKYRKTIEKIAQEALLLFSGGDARILLNALEIAVENYKEKKITKETIEDIFQKRSHSLYDKNGEEHYNIISAFIKSMRGSDANATLYYLVRMLENGEEPTFIARRMIIFASEDIGLADRGALIQTNEAYEAVDKIGMPESQLILAHVATYLAKAPKSRMIPNALRKAKEILGQYPNEPIPLHLRNAPTKLMKEIGYSKGYKWNDDYVGPTKDQSFLPEKIKNETFFEGKK